MTGAGKTSRPAPTVATGTTNQSRSKTSATDSLKSTAGVWISERRNGEVSMQQPNPPPAFIPRNESRIRFLKSLEQRDVRRYFRTGLNRHDQTAGALLRGALYFIAARAGIGKTAFLFKLAYLQAVAG